MITQTAIEWLEEDFDKRWQKAGRKYETIIENCRVFYYSVARQSRYDTNETEWPTYTPSMIDIKTQLGGYG